MSETSFPPPGDAATAPLSPIAAAALALAAERPWRDITLRDIAARAGSSLAAMRDAGADSKAAVVAEIIRAFDEAMLRDTADLTIEAGARRDALFEVVMARLDAMRPYRPAIRSIMADASMDAAVMRASLASQAWMLQAAGIDTSGVEGGVRVAGLASVYASVLRTWIDDDDPGMARTMAALDRRLRRGERSMSTLDEIGRFVRGLGDTATSILRGGSQRDGGSAGRGSDAAPPPQA